MNFIKFWKSFLSPISLSFGGGGGGGPTQTTSTSQTSNIPEYAQPYVENMLASTQKQIYTTDPVTGEQTGFKPYQAYSANPSDYVAAFSPLQQQAMSATGQLQVPGQYGQATQMTGMAGLGSLGLAGQMAGAGQNYAQQATDPNATAAYMSPYMQNVVDYQKSQALRDYNLGTGVRKAQAVGQGAFGGNRQALMEAEAQRSLGNQLQGITAQGSQQAFQDAQKQQQFGAQLGMQGQQGAMQGLGQYGAMGAQLGQLGGQELASRQGIIQAQYGMGQQQQAAEQQKINQAIQDWSNTQQYPLMQLGVMSNMLRGLPMQAATTNQYVAAPNALTQGIGAAGAGASLYNALKGKKGGLPKEFESSNGIKSYYEGDVVESTKSDLYDLPLNELEKQARTSPSSTIKRLANSIIKERTGKAGGGIIAFKEPTAENNQSLVKERVNPAGITAAEVVSTPVVDPAMRVLRDEMLPPPSAAPVVKAAERVVEAPVLFNRQTGSSMTQADVQKHADSNFKGDLPSTVDFFTKLGFTGTPTTAAPPAAALPAAAPPAAAPVKAEVNPASIVAAAPAAVPVKPTDKSKTIFGGLTEADIAAQVRKDQAEADKPLIERYREREAADKAAGIDNKVQENRRAEVMAERASSKDEAKRQMDLRLTAFFADWATQPGNTLVAGMNSLKKAIPDIITDKQEQRKYLKEINKTIYDLDNSVRLEKKGRMDKAEEVKQKAADKMQKWYPEILKYQSDRLSDEAKIKAAGISATPKDTYSDKVFNDALAELVAKGMNPNDPATRVLARKSVASISGLTGEKVDAGKEALVVKSEKDSPVLKSLQMERYGTDENSKEREAIDRKIEIEKQKIRENVFKTTTAPVVPAAPTAVNAVVPPAPDISTIKGAPAGSAIGAYVKDQGYEIRDKSGKLLGYAK